MTSIDIHILQSVPPSNINRDDNGSPKTAIYGGVRRSRVSSQAWKRATREHYQEYLDDSELGSRTKRLAALVAARISDLRPGTSDEDAIAGAWGALKGLGLKPEKSRKKDDNGPANTQYLVFLSNLQINALAELAVENELGELSARVVKPVVKQGHGISLSLFGRMIADDADLNVDASVQVAHALSTHAVDPEFDFYTAVDDHNPDEETGAGMMGTIEFNSSTLYRYATISLDALLENLGDTEAVTRAVEAFVSSFAKSMPSGKQNTFANGTLPHAVVVMARPGQGVSMIGAFEEPVIEGVNGGFVRGSSEALALHSRELDEAFGESPDAVWVTRVGEATKALDSISTAVPFTKLVSSVGEYIRAALSESA